MEASTRSFFSMIRDAIDGRPLSALSEGTDPRAVFYLAKKTHLVPLLRPLVPESWLADEKAKRAWDDTLRRAVMKDVRQTEALETLLPAMTGAGLSVMLLKGSRIKNYYPSPEGRYMSDIDLFYRGEDSILFRVMRKLGYQEVLVGYENHHVWSLPPWVTVEQHFSLGRSEIPLMNVLAGCWERATPDPDRPGVSLMSDGDLYLHMVAHALKHFMTGGSVSLRTLLDFALFRRANPAVSDASFVRNALRDAELEGFERAILRLAGWVETGEGDLLPEDEAQLARAVGAGLYGNTDGRVAWQLSGSGKVGFFARLRYLLSRVFPPLSQISVRFGRKKWGWIVYPFVWSKRLFEILFAPTRRRNLSREVRSVRRADGKSRAEYLAERAYFGLSPDLSIPDED